MTKILEFLESQIFGFFLNFPEINLNSSKTCPKSATFFIIFENFRKFSDFRRVTLMSVLQNCVTNSIHIRQGHRPDQI